MTVNGSDGGLDRRVNVAAGQPITASLSSLYAAPEPFAVIGFVGVPDTSFRRPIPYLAATHHRPGRGPGRRSRDRLQPDGLPPRHQRGARERLLNAEGIGAPRTTPRQRRRKTLRADTWRSFERKSGRYRDMRIPGGEESLTHRVSVTDRAERATSARQRPVVGSRTP